MYPVRICDGHYWDVPQQHDMVVDRISIYTKQGHLITAIFGQQFHPLLRSTGYCLLLQYQNPAGTAK